MYCHTTRGIKVTVEPFYVEEESEPSEDHYFWAYTIEVENGGEETVRLISRKWLIVDGNGEKFNVEGDGVVGEQPVLEPGTSFEYTSGCPLKTNSGIMSGSYIMSTKVGEEFAVKIPTFSLDIPDQPRTIN